jgi:hypothetical protein
MVVDHVGCNWNASNVKTNQLQFKRERNFGGLLVKIEKSNPYTKKENRLNPSSKSSVAELEPEPQGAASFGRSRSRNAMRLRYGIKHG